MHAIHPSYLLLVQLLIVLALSRAMGSLFQAIRQPRVLGEMLAGIMLGPSLFGWLWPGGWHAMFPVDSVQSLSILSQLGVLFFLFLVGLELDPKLIRNRGQTALIVSHVSIVAPFLLGAALTLYLYPRLCNDSPRMTFVSVALFMGAAMSITAFPVLARILTERNLHKTPLGAMAITCAAIDDLTAWCMLAFVVGVARSSGIVPGLYTAALAALYVAAMLLLVRPFLGRLQALHDRQGRLSPTIVALILLMMLGSAALTEWIGIHALFGAFCIGAVMPKGTRFVAALTEKLEDVTVLFLLPVFFAFTGLRTQIGLLNNSDLWIDTAAIIAVACAGKFGGSALAGRLCGMGWREASAIGILMNTRGLMELVILNIGLQEGVITPVLFAMMVLMALATTFLTTPLLHLVVPRQALAGAASTSEQAGYRILIPVSFPDSGPTLARLAKLLLGSERGLALALHLRRPSEHSAYHVDLNTAEDAGMAPLTPLLVEATRKELAVEPISFTSTDVADDIAAVAKARHANLILMGFHKPVFTRSVLGGVVHGVIDASNADLAILVDRGSTYHKLLVPLIGGGHDALALALAARMHDAVTDITVTLLHLGELPAAGFSETLKRFLASPRVTQRSADAIGPVSKVLEAAADHDLLMIGVDERWGLEPRRVSLRPERIVRNCPCSMLIVRSCQANCV